MALRFPFGHALGEPENVLQQRRILLEALRLLAGAREPSIEALTALRWKRTDYAALPPVDLPDGRSLR